MQDGEEDEKKGKAPNRRIPATNARLLYGEKKARKAPKLRISAPSSRLRFKKNEEKNRERQQRFAFL
jgi:hypothetical protein